jgi:hypothetical protein
MCVQGFEENISDENEISISCRLWIHALAVLALANGYMETSHLKENGTLPVESSFSKPRVPEYLCVDHMLLNNDSGSLRDWS